MTNVTWRVEHLEHVDSTNSWLAERARAGAPAGTAVYADFQSAGRGRLDREWVSPSGSSLLCSVLLDTANNAAAPQVFVQAAALAMGEALVRLTGVRPLLKWPNDLLFGDAKVAGLLAEIVAGQIVVGLGLNLSAVDPDYADATTVLAATGVAPSARHVLDAYLEALARQCESLWSLEGVTTVREQYVAALSTLGRRVRVELAHEVVRGVALGVDDTGALIIDTGLDQRVVTAGDVVHLRREEST